jgi:hypothetical protein
VTLHHFAGLIGAAWQENDYLWGRLDAARLGLRRFGAWPDPGHASTSYEPAGMAGAHLRPDLRRRRAAGADRDRSLATQSKRSASVSTQRGDAAVAGIVVQHASWRRGESNLRIAQTWLRRRKRPLGGSTTHAFRAGGRCHQNCGQVLPRERFDGRDLTGCPINVWPCDTGRTRVGHLIGDSAARQSGDPAKYELAGSHCVVGVTLPDMPVSAAGSPRPVTGESNGSPPSATRPRLLSVDAARYRVRIFFLRRVTVVRKR